MGQGLSLDGATLWKRAALAGLAHLVLLAAWPLARWAYAPAFRELMQLTVAVIAPLPESIEIGFAPGSGGVMAEDLVRMDTVVSLRPREFEGEPATFGASSFYHGYFPTTVLLALFAAAAFRGGFRRGPLLFALALLYVGIALRCLPSIYYCYSQCTVDGQSPLGLGPAGARALFMLRHLSWVEVLPNYLVPLVLFALFGARRPGGAQRS